MKSNVMFVFAKNFYYFFKPDYSVKEFYSYQVEAHSLPLVANSKSQAMRSLRI